MSDIQVRHVSKAFGSTQVLEAIDLDVRDGEFISLVGPSGCGKSTLLRILAGLEAADQGEILMAGARVDALSPGDRDIAMVFQSYALYPHLSVRDNLAVPLNVRRLSRWQRLPVLGRWWPGARRIRQRIDEEVKSAASLLDISHLLDRKPAQLSGGQRQRTALGRALVRRPRAYLMDEPLSNLDANLRVQMRTEIAALHRSIGGTFVYVTHDQTEAMTMSDRVAVMMDGRLLQVASPAEIYFDPKDLRVAEFVGNPKLNRLAARADGLGTLWHRDVRLPASLPSPAAEGLAVTLGIRPEAVRLRAPDPRGLRARVTGHEHLGADILVHLVVLASGTPMVARHDSLTPAPSKDALVTVDWDADRTLAFDGDGRRMPIRDRHDG